MFYAGISKARACSQLRFAAEIRDRAFAGKLKAKYNEEGKRAGLPEYLFCKTTPTVLTRLATGLSAAGEGRFYRQIRPELNIEAPQCYHSAWDRRSGRSVHLFDDLIANKAAQFCK